MAPVYFSNLMPNMYKELWKRYYLLQGKYASHLPTSITPYSTKTNIYNANSILYKQSNLYFISSGIEKETIIVCLCNLI